MRFSQKTVFLSKLGFIANLLAMCLDVTRRMFTQFLTFSMVFPNTELFINLEKSFSKSFLAAALKFVLRLMYFFIHGLSLYLIPRCTFMYFCFCH